MLTKNTVNEVTSLRDITLKQIMEQAYRNHIVVPAFNVPYLPMIKTIVETLKANDCFGLVAVARPDVDKFEAKSFRSVAEEFEKYADKGYARLHQDHVPVIDEDGQKVNWKNLITEAIALRYDSVMVDGSRLSLEENIEAAKIAVELAHPAGVLVEAELGAVLGHEKGPLPPYEELFSSGKGFTVPLEAERFVKQTGIDWLSVAIGSIHGALSGAAKDQKKVAARLNIEHLKKLAKVTNIPLVLHGGSGIRQEGVLNAVKNGITKINVGTALRQAYEKGLKEQGGVKAAQDAVRREVEYCIRKDYYIQGSAGKLLFFLRSKNFNLG